jgi:hypothetical protein
VLGLLPDAVDLDRADAGESARCRASRSMPLSSSHFAALVSLQSETMKSRQASAASTSSRAALAASFARRARPRRAQQRLRRDARPVRALAADQLALDERDAQAALASAPAQCSPGEPPPSTIAS